MPLYDFQHPETSEVKEVFFQMEEENKTYIDELGVEWKRVFSPTFLSATYRTFDEKRLVDKNGKPLRIQKFSDEFIRRQGFDNAADYIDHNNATINPEKTPEANTQKMHDQLRNQDVQSQLKENKRVLKENAKNEPNFGRNTKKLKKK